MAHGKGARHAAISVLARWQGSGLPMERFLDGLREDSGLHDPRDQGLATALVLCTLRNLRRLDWAIGHFSSRPLRKLKNEVLQGLRVGACQLLVMDRIPFSAAVNETVAALKNLGEPKWVTGFVNGVLRSIARARAEDPAWPGNAKLPEAVRLNLPDWLWERWRERFGRETAELLAAEANVPPPLSLRVRAGEGRREELLALLSEKGITAEPGQYAPTAILLPAWQGPVADLPGLRDGLFQVQDEAAQLATLLLAPFVPGGYLDACAGLGGKTAHLAELAPAGSNIMAVEPDARRFRLLEENLALLRLSALVECRRERLEQLCAGAKTFPRILVDAPCSGLGVIRRHPDIPWNRAPRDFSRYREGQLALLATAAALLAPGGVLVYAVCTFEPEETTGVLDAFLADHPEFVRTDAAEYLPETARAFADTRGFFSTHLHPGGLDGFFAARLKKNVTPHP